MAEPQGMCNSILIPLFHFNSFRNIILIPKLNLQKLWKMEKLEKMQKWEKLQKYKNWKYGGDINFD